LIATEAALGSKIKQVAQKHGMHERRVYEAIARAGGRKAGKENFAKSVALLEREAAKRQRTQPRVKAFGFLFEQLRDGPRRATELAALADKAGIKSRTPRRIGPILGVEKHRIGGSHGHWIWQLSAEARKYFGLKI
jgi:hypothetical protein